MNTSLLAIERGEGIDRVAELFRAVHTVKGMAAAMGYADVRDLSHALEALLDQLRRGALEISPAVIDALFDAVDTLETAIVAVSQQNSESVDVLGSVEVLESLAASGTEGPNVNPTMEWPVMRPDAVAEVPAAPGARVT